MTEQKKKIIVSADYIGSRNPFKTKVNTAVITYLNPSFLKEFKLAASVPYEKIPPAFDGGKETGNGAFIFATAGKKNFYLLNGHLNYYEGYDMRNSAHPVYVLKELGVENLMIIDDVGHLNPRYKVGGVSFIYDHINFMGDNPLIGENDNTLGPRFPDMSNAYDEKLYSVIEKYLIEKKFRYFPSVYIGVTGPETETEAECRFYREIGSDVVGYSLIPENLAAVHCGMKCAAFGMISRELVADKLQEITNAQKAANRAKAEKAFAPILKELIDLL
jgi:purine-nucleoside phosphorylase